MDSDVASFAQVAVIIVGLVGSLALIAVVMVRALNRGARPPKQQTLNDDRLEQLQLSIDAIAVEVERIAEAQRFSAKLLAERGEERQLSH
jgi:hypothetical protein